MFDNPTDNHTDIEVPLYDKLRFHEANQCWPRSPTPYGITRPQIVKVVLTRWVVSLRCCAITVNILRPQQNGCCFADHILKCISLESKLFYFNPNFIEICSEGSKWWYIGLGKGLGLNRQQAITWISNDKVLWHHMEPPGRNELKCEQNQHCRC